MSLTLKDIELISSVTGISDEKYLLTSIKEQLSEDAHLILSSNLSCNEICLQWAKSEGIEFISSLSTLGYFSNYKIIDIIGVKIIETYQMIPAINNDFKEVLLTYDPFNFSNIEEFTLIVGHDLPICYINQSLLTTEISNIKTNTSKGVLSEILVSLNSNVPSINNEDKCINIELESEHQSPIVCFVNSVFIDAISIGASDVHFESKPDCIQARIRKDGEMKKQSYASNDFKTPVIARLKVISGLDTSEHRIPQDGRIKIKYASKIIDARISCVPSMYGERIVARFLGSTNKHYAPITDFSLEIQNIIKKIAKMPEGMIVVTGPTGSGKTTTLYHILEEINSSERNVITIEDPIEKEISGASQIQIQEDQQFDFADALKHVLRQDPDVIMIGEIRDILTAKTALQAAITGHLILSTLHAPDARTSILRLLDIGAEKFIVSNAIKFIISQRLVKKLCHQCLGKCMDCAMCENRGFYGRIAIVEYMEIDEEIKEMISKSKTSKEIWSYAIANKKAKSMIDYGNELISKCLTTKEEIEKCIGEINNHETMLYM